MRYLILLALMLCLPVRGEAWQVVGGGVASDGGYTISQTAEDNAILNIYNGKTRGQSFLATSDGTLVKFRFKTGSTGSGGNGTVDVRCGAARDLSTMYVGGSVANVSNATIYEVALSGGGLSVTSGNTYYCAATVVSNLYADRVSLAYIANDSTYANGHAQTATGWVLSDSNYDHWFEAVVE